MLNDTEDPSVPGRGRLPTHAERRALCRCSRRAHGPPFSFPFLRTLNGTWRFHLYRAPTRYLRALRTTTTTTAPGPWGNPGNWRLQASDLPYYTNNQFPFPPDDLPRATSDNPTGVYRCRFDLRPRGPAARYGSPSTASTTAFHAWLNGAAIGFSEAASLARRV